MADIFTMENTRELLKNKVVWLFGDSNVRAIYKDFVWLLQKNTLMTEAAAKCKLPLTFQNDRLMKGDKLSRGRNFKEERLFTLKELNVVVEFMFLTKCLTEDFKEKLAKLKKGQITAPNIVIMNSCLWDIVRWGPTGVQAYKQNIVTLMKLLKESLPRKTLMIWTTTPPIACDPYGGLFIEKVEFIQHALRFEVLEANLFVRLEAVAYGFDVLDIHYHLRLQIHRRSKDGLHWTPPGIRHITNLLLTHICLSFGVPLPGTFVSSTVEKMKNHVPDTKLTKPDENMLEKLDQLLNNNADKTEPNKNVKAREPPRRHRHQSYRHHRQNYDGYFKIPAQPTYTRYYDYYRPY